MSKLICHSWIGPLFYFVLGYAVCAVYRYLEAKRK